MVVYEYINIPQMWLHRTAGVSPPSPLPGIYCCIYCSSCPVFLSATTFWGLFWPSKSLLWPRCTYSSDQTTDSYGLRPNNGFLWSCQLRTVLIVSSHCAGVVRVVASDCGQHVYVYHPRAKHRLCRNGPLIDIIVIFIHSSSSLSPEVPKD